MVCGCLYRDLLHFVFGFHPLSIIKVAAKADPSLPQAHV